MRHAAHAAACAHAAAAHAAHATACDSTTNAVAARRRSASASAPPPRRRPLGSQHSHAGPMRNLVVGPAGRHASQPLPSLPPPCHCRHRAPPLRFRIRAAAPPPVPMLPAGPTRNLVVGPAREWMYKLAVNKQIFYRYVHNSFTHRTDAPLSVTELDLYVKIVLLTRVRILHTLKLHISVNLLLP